MIIVHSRGSNETRQNAVKMYKEVGSFQVDGRKRIKMRLVDGRKARHLYGNVYLTLNRPIT